MFTAYNVTFYGILCQGLARDRQKQKKVAYGKTKFKLNGGFCGHCTRCD